MIVLDVNILLYAYTASSPQHSAITEWLEDLLASRELIGLPWVTAWAFVRIASNPRLTLSPPSAPEIFAHLRELYALPSVRRIEPGPRHLEILEKLVTASQSEGPRVTDAVLAAIAIEHGATLASTDRDFSRFTGLRWLNPLDAK